MRALRGTDDTGRLADPLHPENLRDLLTQAPASVVLDDEGPGPAARAERVGAERWRVEVRSPGRTDRLVTEVPNTDAAFDVLRSWAADDGWWQEVFLWRPVTG